MTAYEWAHQSPRCITREKFFGGDLNGPMLNSLLHHADALHDFLPDDLKKFAQALNALDALKKACFSLTVLPAWERKHEEFVMAWHRCGIPRTPKFHIIEVNTSMIMSALKSLIQLGDYLSTYIMLCVTGTCSGMDKVER